MPHTRRRRKPSRRSFYTWRGNTLEATTLVKLYRKAGEYVELNISQARLAGLSAYYTQARYPNAGIERPSIEITREQAEEAVMVAEEVINEVSKAIRDP